jgi:hypothetical protein
MPSFPTLFFRSTWNEDGNCGPILTTVRLYCILQLDTVISCYGAGRYLLAVVATVRSKRSGFPFLLGAIFWRHHPLHS